MGWGFSRINTITLIHTSQGLADYLLTKEPRAKEKGVVVGFDARHNSRDFAQRAAAIFRRNDMRVYGYGLPVHTPMVPFAVKYFKAAAGVMITASHNPAPDNGYKVYGSNGCQINSPIDGEILQHISRSIFEPPTCDVNSQLHLHQNLTASIDSLYLDTLERVISKPQDATSCPRFVYTPLHGVGGSMMVKACGRLGFLKQMTVVPEQAYPDPDFPTVKFPNPEEKGALDMAIDIADRENIHLIFANDPDADRFAAAEKVGNQWHQFTGDEVGVLLAEHLMENQSEESSYMITTAVSSQRLSVVAAKRNVIVQETLTGFRWIGERTLALEAQGKKVSFGYEEALGYMLPNVVYDKDGIAAAMVFLRACAEWKSPFAKLQEINEKLGYFETKNDYLRLNSPQECIAFFKRTRNVIRGLTEVAGRPILRCRDLYEGYDSDAADHLPDLPSGRNNYMITCWLGSQSGEARPADQGVRFTIRASGTEPKIKFYCEGRASSREAAKDGAIRVFEDIAGNRLSPDIDATGPTIASSSRSNT